MPHEDKLHDKFLTMVDSKSKKEEENKYSGNNIHQKRAFPTSIGYMISYAAFL